MRSSPEVPPDGARTTDEERRLRHIVEATPNAMVMVDARGSIVLVNAQTEVLFGYGRAELLSMRVEELIPPRLRALHADYRQSFFGAPDTRAMGAGRDLYGLRKDGTEVPIEIGLNPLETEEGAFVLASIIDITERKRSEERLVQVVEAAPNAMVMVNESGRIVLVNSQAERSFGYTREELLEMRVEDLIPQRFRRGHRTFRESFFAVPSRREMGAGRDLYGLRKDGSEIPIEIGLNPIQIMDDNFVLASIIDITERLVLQETENAMRADHLRIAILDSLPFSIIATDLAGTIITANPAAAKLLGYQQGDLTGSPIHEIRRNGEDASGQTPAADLQPTDDDGRELAYRRHDGSSISVNEVVSTMTDDDGHVTGYLTVAYDITKRKEAQDAVRHLAHHDVLTDLPNRAMMFDHLSERIGAAHRAGTKIAVLLLDLDHFKRVNDSLGHHVGDELLLRMAARLKRCVRENDLVARLGGDEFVIVFDEVDAGEDLAPRIDELMLTVSGPLEVHGHELIATASMGGALYPLDGPDPSALLKSADIAMYHAKVSGRNNFQWFQSSMLEEANDRLALSGALRHALARGEFSLSYQPQVSLDTGKVVGIEALARWDSPLLGAVSPERFIAVAEDGGMINELGEWVLRRACSDGVAAQARLGHPLKVAVNVSPRQFRSGNLLHVLDAALADSGFDPGNLALEITEGILLDEPNDVIDTLHAIRRLGAEVVVDDFGTGFSSLSYLTRFPIDKIKIDRSFVQDLTVEADAAIVDTVIVMAHTLGMKVVAEGVETAEQRAYLSERGCDEVQGYLYSRGVAADRLTDVVQQIDRQPQLQR